MHTQEPWEVYEGSEGNTFTNFTGWCSSYSDKHKENADRICACVNACAGIEDPQELIADIKRLLMTLDGKKTVPSIAAAAQGLYDRHFAKAKGKA